MRTLATKIFSAFFLASETLRKRPLITDSLVLRIFCLYSDEKGSFEKAFFASIEFQISSV